MQGIGTKTGGILRLAVLAGALSLSGCALFAPQPEIAAPVPEIVVEPPQPVVEIAPQPEPPPRKIEPRPFPEIAIVLASRQPAYEEVANELGDRLENFIGTNIIYNCEQNLTVFDHMRAEQRQPTGNSELANVNEEIAIKYLQALDQNSIVMQVQAKLIEMMPSGPVSESMVASELNLSLRSMQRKLGEEKTSFSSQL